MERLPYPLWLVFEREAGVSRPVTVGGRAVAFTRAEDASSYMAALGAAGWESLLVSRTTLPPLAARLRAAGITGLLLDPVGDRCAAAEFDGGPARRG